MQLNLTRRGFMKLSTAAAIASGAGLGVKSEKARAFDASIATLLSIDPATLEYKVFSSCCYYCTDYYIVSHYQPVVLCEVIKGGGDAAMGSDTGSILSTGTDNNDYTSMQVRLWEIPDWAVDMAMMYQGCKMCGVDAARQEANPSMDSKGACGQATDQMMQKATDQLNENLPDCFPKLLYTTETDPTWSTGCRDITRASQLSAVQCSSFASMFQMDGSETCVGTEWGPLYPRQMAHHNDNAAIAAGVAAYRALHVSRFAVGSLPFDASISIGKLQQTSPHVTVGFGAGSAMLNSGVRQGNMSLEEIYTYVWWVPVVCCKTYDEIMGMCEPSMPCS